MHVHRVGVLPLVRPLLPEGQGRQGPRGDEVDKKFTFLSWLQGREWSGVVVTNG